MPKLPFFPLDIARWVQSEARTEMTLQQRGLYFELMALQWREGSIPTDRDKLKRAVSCTDEEFESAASVVLPHFNIRVGPLRRQNAVIEEVRAKVLAKQQRLSEAGREGGIKKAKAFVLNKSSSQATSLANGEAVAGASQFSVPVRGFVQETKTQESGNGSGYTPEQAQAGWEKLRALCAKEPVGPSIRTDRACQLFISRCESQETEDAILAWVAAYKESAELARGVVTSLEKVLGDGMWKGVLPKHVSEQERKKREEYKALGL